MDVYEDIYGADAVFTLDDEGPRREELEERCRALEAENVSLRRKLERQRQRNDVLERNLSAIYNTAKKELHARDQVIAQMVQQQHGTRKKPDTKKT